MSESLRNSSVATLEPASSSTPSASAHSMGWGWRIGSSRSPGGTFQRQTRFPLPRASIALEEKGWLAAEWGVSRRTIDARKFLPHHPPAGAADSSRKSASWGAYRARHQSFPSPPPEAIRHAAITCAASSANLPATANAKDRDPLDGRTRVVSGVGCPAEPHRGGSAGERGASQREARPCRGSGAVKRTPSAMVRGWGIPWTVCCGISGTRFRTPRGGVRDSASSRSSRLPSRSVGLVVIFSLVNALLLKPATRIPDQNRLRHDHAGERGQSGRWPRRLAAELPPDWQQRNNRVQADGHV